MWSGLWEIVYSIALNSVLESGISIESVVFGFLRLLKIDTKCSRIIEVSLLCVTSSFESGSQGQEVS